MIIMTDESGRIVGAGANSQTLCKSISALAAQREGTEMLHKSNPIVDSLLRDELARQVDRLRALAKAGLL